MNRKQYEEDLQRRQKEHLDNIQRNNPMGSNFGDGFGNWRPCLHDGCPECIGTGVKFDGSMCIHNISCPCPKCTPSYTVEQRLMGMDLYETSTEIAKLNYNKGNQNG